jgi:hypothetical protein
MGSVNPEILDSLRRENVIRQGVVGMKPKPPPKWLPRPRSGPDADVEKQLAYLQSMKFGNIDQLRYNKGERMRAMSYAKLIDRRSISVPPRMPPTKPRKRVGRVGSDELEHMMSGQAGHYHEILESRDSSFGWMKYAPHMVGMGMGLGAMYMADRPTPAPLQNPRLQRKVFRMPPKNKARNPMKNGKKMAKKMPSKKPVVQRAKPIVKKVYKESKPFIDYSKPMITRYAQVRYPKTYQGFKKGQKLYKKGKQIKRNYKKKKQYGKNYWRNNYVN